MADPRRIPTDDEIRAASIIPVSDRTGKAIPFGSVFANTKTIVVFIRHFFCGRCQDYVTQLAGIPQDRLDTAQTKIVVIGCGDWSVINSYAETTGFKGEIFADSTRKLYHSLGMDIENLKRTPSDQKPRSYISSGIIMTVLSSIWRLPLKNPTLIGKQGNISQLGGEFICGPGNTCTFASRMQHSEDHIEVVDLLNAAGI